MAVGAYTGSISTSCSAPRRSRAPAPFRSLLLGTAAGYFWLCYSLMGLARIYGPNQPDAFYGISLCLMLTGLLVRFADRWFSPDR